MDYQCSRVTVMISVVLLAISAIQLVNGDGQREHVHLKIHIPKIIKKHTHVQTIYKHLLQKVPVLEEGHDHHDHHEEYRDGSEQYVRVDPKLTLAALRASDKYEAAKELRSVKWSPKYSYHDGERESHPRAMPLKGLKRYPKNVKIVHQYEEYPKKSHRIVKHVIPTYEEDDDDDYDHSSYEEYAESRPKKSYLKTKKLKFIPASDVSQYIPTIPFSSLATAQSQFKPVWTPSEFVTRPSQNIETFNRPSRSSRFEGTKVRVFSTNPSSSSSYSSPLLPIGSHLERRFERNFD